MGSGITPSGSDPGFRVTSDGIRISQFFLVLEGIKDRSLFRYFIFYEKQEYSVLQGKRPLFRTIEKAFNLYTSILLRFRHVISCLKLFSLVLLCGFRFVGLSEKSDTRLSVPCAHDAGLTMDKSRKRSRERRYDSLTSILQLLPYPYRIDLLISWL